MPTCPTGFMSKPPHTPPTLRQTPNVSRGGGSAVTPTQTPHDVTTNQSTIDSTPPDNDPAATIQKQPQPPTKTPPTVPYTLPHGLPESQFNKHQLLHILQHLRSPSPVATTPNDQKQSPLVFKDRVDQSLQRPVTWNKEHFEAFLKKKPPEDALCEVCCEKILALDDTDVEYLHEAFKRLDAGSAPITGHVTEDEMTQVLMQWIDKRSGTGQGTFEMDHLKTLYTTQDSKDGAVVKYKLFLDRMLGLHSCQTLCVCRPPRWIHNTCMNEKLALGLNAKRDFLLKCGFCRASLWGESYTQWLHEASRLETLLLANKIVEGRKEVADKVYELSMDVASVAIRCGGGGVKRNAMLGSCLAMVGSAICTQQAASNNGCPYNHLSGQICVMAMRMGAPATTRTAWVLNEMRWNTDYTMSEDTRNEEERQRDLKQHKHWSALAMHCCQTSKRYAAKEDTALLMRVECMVIEISMHTPGVTVEDMLGQVQAWPWSLEELSVFALYSVCSLLLENDGICFMEKYLERGERIVAEDPAPENPELFHELRAEYDYSIGLEREDK